jgi:hypothetical protein
VKSFTGWSENRFFATVNTHTQNKKQNRCVVQETGFASSWMGQIYFCVCVENECLGWLSWNEFLDVVTHLSQIQVSKQDIEEYFAGWTAPYEIYKVTKTGKGFLTRARSLIAQSNLRRCLSLMFE